MTTPAKTYWPTLGRMIYVMCRFIQRHRVTLEEVMLSKLPGKQAEVEAAFLAIATFCALFETVVVAIDPNWKP